MVRGGVECLAPEAGTGSRSGPVEMRLCTKLQWQCVGRRDRPGSVQNLSSHPFREIERSVNGSASTNDYPL